MKESQAYRARTGDDSGKTARVPDCFRATPPRSPGDQDRETVFWQFRHPVKRWRKIPPGGLRLRPAFLPDDAGAALVLVLWVLVLLSVIAGAFGRRMRTEIAATRGFMEQTKCYYIARAGLATALSALFTTEDPFRINANNPEVPFGEGRFKIRIDNESGKIDLNRADRRLLTALFSGLGLDEKRRNTIVDSILDWRDPDSLHRLNGAEDDYYEGLPEPYPCKDGPFEDPAELRKVRGVTPELYDSEIAFRVTVTPDSAFRQAGRNSLLGGRKDASPQGKINVNAASRSMLTALPGVTNEAAEAIVQYRQEADIRQMGDLVAFLSPEEARRAALFLDTRGSPFYTIIVLGALNTGDVRKGFQVLVEIEPKSKTYYVHRWVDDLMQPYI